MQSVQSIWKSKVLSQEKISAYQRHQNMMRLSPRILLPGPDPPGPMQRQESVRPFPPGTW